jgi:hypothetical protein
LRGVVPQEEIDKVTTVEAWYYSLEDYAKLTTAKKQKHYQLMQLKKAGKTPGRTNKSLATVAELPLAIFPQLHWLFLSLLLRPRSTLLLKVGRPMMMMCSPTLNGDGTATTQQLLAAKST